MCYAVSNDSYSLTMLLCLVLLKILNSCITLRLDASSFMNYLLIDFNATNLPDSLCMAKFTLPNAPLPITFPIL